MESQWTMEQNRCAEKQKCLYSHLEKSSVTLVCTVTSTTGVTTLVTVAWQCRYSKAGAKPGVECNNNNNNNNYYYYFFFLLTANWWTLGGSGHFTCYICTHYEG
jgi:hypothetical protein